MSILQQRRRRSAIEGFLSGVASLGDPTGAVFDPIDAHQYYRSPSADCRAFRGDLQRIGRDFDRVIRVEVAGHESVAR